MAETSPGLLDYLGYGPYAQDAVNLRLAAAKKDEERKRLQDLLELSILTRQNRQQGIEDTGIVEDGPFAVNIPQFAPRADQQAEQAILQQEQGLNVGDLIKQQRENDIMRLLPDLPATAQIDALNNKPITAALPLADYRTEKTNEQRTRNEALSKLLDDGGTDNLLAIGNDSSPRSTGGGTSNRPIKAIVGGKPVYVHRVLQPDGTFGYEPVKTATGEPLLVPPSSNETSLQRNTRFLVDIGYAGDEKEAATRLLQLKSKSPDAAYAQIVEKLALANFASLAGRPDKLLEKANQVFAVSHPGLPVPANSSALIEQSLADAAARANQQAAPQGAAQPQTTPVAQNGAAAATGGAPAQALDTPEAVRDAYKRGEISRSEALSRLKAMGFE